MAIDASKLLPAGRPGTPEGTVVQQGTPAGYMSEKQFNSVNGSIRAINNNLIGIQKLLAQDVQLTEKVEANKQVDTKRRVDSTKKGQKETFIESTIQKTLVKPVQAIGKKATGAFGNFFQALTTIFAGWMLDKGGKALKAWQEGDTSMLEDIKNNVLKALLAAGGVFLALNGGIPLLLGALKTLIGGLVAGIPAILALLANPATWIAAAAALAGVELGKFLGNEENAKNESSKNVEENVAKEGIEETLKKLEEERKAIEGNWFKYYVLGEGLELERQIEALKKGYKSADDPQIKVGKPEGEVKADLLPMFAQTVVKENPATEQEMATMGKLEEGYRRLGGMQQAQTSLQSQIKDLGKRGDPDKKVPQLQKQLGTTKTTIEQVTNELTVLANEGLSDQHKLALKALMTAVFTKPDGTMSAEISSDQYKSLATMVNALYPGAPTPEPTTPAEIQKPAASTTAPAAEPEQSTSSLGPVDAQGFLLRGDGSGKSTGIHQDDVIQALEDEKKLNQSGLTKPPTSTPDLKGPPKSQKVEIVPISMDKPPEQGDESLYSGDATGIPEIFTVNQNNDYLSFYKGIYGVDA